ncbi:MAG: response regulator [Bacteroidales bacterium]|nr:response regulator [Bacteroidales bacterium]
MQKILDELEQKILNAQNLTDFQQWKESILTDVRLLRKSNEVSAFKFNRLIRDKNVLHSLLARTSDDLKSALNELSKRAEELNTLLFAIPAMVYFKDIDLSYVLVNKAFEEFSGQVSKSIIGRTTEQVFLDYHDNEYSEIERKVIETGKPHYHIEERLSNETKTTILSTNLAPVKNGSSQTIGLVGVSWDITEQANFQAKLVKAKEAAEAGTKAKSEFLANMSHEIRTPLNGILGMSEILSKSLIQPKDQEHIEIIIASGHSLLALVNDILDFSKIEAGWLSFESADFDFIKMGGEVLHVMNVKAQEKGLTFKVNYADNIPQYLNGDAYRLKQVWLNLANNAVKFTEKGGVVIENELVELGDDSLVIKTKVIDTGIGIRSDQVKKLFNSFEQLDASNTRKYGGTGLGLAISKKLVEMMNGSIGVESEPDVGSVFWFAVKLKRATQQPRPGKKTAPAFNSRINKKLHVLLAEDNLINQKVATYSLHQMGFTVEIANNGLEAVEKYTQTKYDLILMDVQMPELSGFDATRRIRSLENSSGHGARIPIIALTANAMKGDMERCIAAGMDAYLSKPFQQIDLMELIAHYFND